MRSRWLWLLFLLLFGWITWDMGSDGSWWVAGGFALVVLAISWWSYPHRGAGARGPGHRDGPGAGFGAPVVVYWRPGCVYCSALRRRLGRSGRAATWVNIWTDAEAAAYVRSVNSGNETVPTVVIDGAAHTNPPAEKVRKVLLNQS